MDVKKVILLPLLTVVATFSALVGINAAEVPVVTYHAHVQNIGWMDRVTASNSIDTAVIAGTEGQSLRVEALEIGLSGVENVELSYRTHVQNIGWQDWKSAGEVAGTEGQSLRVEAIEIKTKGLEEYGYVLKYRAHVQNIGWQDWKLAGEVAGTFGKSLRVEAIEIALVPLKDAKAEAKADLKAFLKSPELSAKTVDKKRNKDAAVVASAIDYANNYGMSAIEDATNDEEIANAVADAENEVVQAMRDYFTDVLSSYADEAEVEGVIIGEDDYDAAIEAIEDAEDMAAIIKAYETAMDSSIDLAELRKSTKKELESFVKANLNVKESIPYGNVAKKNGAKYSATLNATVTAINASIDAAANVEAVQDALVEGEERLLDELKAIEEANIEVIYNGGSAKKLTNDTAPYYLEDEDYDDAIDALDAAKTFEDAIAAYDNAIAARKNADVKDLAEFKEDVLDAFNNSTDLDATYKFAAYDPDDYTMSASDVEKARNKFENAVNRVEITSTINLAAAEAKIATAYNTFKDAMANIDDDKTLEATLEGQKTVALGEIATNYTAVLAADEHKDPYNEFTALSRVEAIADAIDAANDAIEDATSKDAVKVAKEKGEANILSKVVAYVKSQVTKLYNSGKKVTVDVYTDETTSSEEKLIFDKDAYTAATNALALSGIELTDALDVYDAFTAVGTSFDTIVTAQFADLWGDANTLETNLNSASAGSADEIAKKAGYFSYDALVKAAKDKAGETSTEAEVKSAINNVRLSFVTKAKAYMLDLINDAVDDKALVKTNTNTLRYAAYETAYDAYRSVYATSAKLDEDWATLTTALGTVNTVITDASAHFTVNYNVTEKADLTDEEVATLFAPVWTTTNSTKEKVTAPTKAGYTIAIKDGNVDADLTDIQADKVFTVTIEKNA